MNWVMLDNDGLCPTISGTEYIGSHMTCTVRADSDGLFARSWEPPARMRKDAVSQKPRTAPRSVISGTYYPSEHK